MNPTKKLFSTLLIALLPWMLVACAEEAGVEGAGVEGDYAEEGVGETDVYQPTDELREVTWEGYGYDWDWGAYEDWDADADARLTETEFGQGFSAVYTDWDADADDQVQWSELETASFDWWDVDDDDRISEQEWNRVTGSWDLEGYEWPAWSEIDTDGDGYVVRTGDEQLYDQEAWAGVWDVDGDEVVSRDEASGIFWDLFDADDDGVIEEEEWGTWTT